MKSTKEYDRQYRVFLRHIAMSVAFFLAGLIMIAVELFDFNSWYAIAFVFGIAIFNLIEGFIAA